MTDIDTFNYRDEIYTNIIFIILILIIIIAQLYNFILIFEKHRITLISSCYYVTISEIIKKLNYIM